VPYRRNIQSLIKKGATKVTRKVPFFDYPRLYLDDEDLVQSVVRDVGSRGAFIMQKDLLELEKQLATYTKSNFSIGVANATDGLELSWMSIGLERGDEVIISSHTMLATASAIVTAGGVPVPVDIDEDGLISPQAIEAAINSRTVGISPTHLNGRTCKMDQIMEIANKRGFAVVEDAAQALGSLYNGKHAGTFGNASAISFFPAKVLGCLGDGGIVLTNDEATYHSIYQLHDHGRDVDGSVKRWGRNSRLDNLQAALLSAKLKDYPSVIQKRRQLARAYHELLAACEEILLPPHPDLDGSNFDVFQNFEVQAKHRDELRDYLSKNGIGTIIQWGGKAVHQWECFNFDVKLPKTEKFFENCLLLPMNVFLSEDDIKYICETITSFYENR
jgi:dTDP-4-amino-4,6-dideoxygalactose transaminase